MFGRRKNSMTSEESGQQSSMILDSLEMVDEEDTYEESLTQDEDLIADMFSDAEVSEDGTVSFDHGFDAEEDVQSEEVGEEAKPKKRGFFSFFRRPKKDIQLYDDAQEEGYEDEAYEDDSYQYDEESIGDYTGDGEGIDFNQDFAEESAEEETQVLEENPSQDPQDVQIPEDLQGFRAPDDSLQGGDSQNLFADGQGYGDPASDETETDWLADGEDLELNPALFALADEMGDPETESGDPAPEEDDIGAFMGALFGTGTGGDRTADGGSGDETIATDGYEAEAEGAYDEEETVADEDYETAGDYESDGDYEEGEDDGDYEEDPLFMDDDRSSRKKILIGAGIGLLALLIAAFFIFRNIRKAPEGKVYVKSVREIMGYNLPDTHSNRYTGVVEAQKQTKITLEEGMTVARCYVKVGDDVKKGDRLFKYDTEALQLQAQKKQLEIDQTNQKINSATKKKAEHDRDIKTKKGIELLDAQQGSAEQELNIETYKLDLQARKKELNAINKNIKNSVVKSKTQGQVLKINTALGKGTTDESESDSAAQENTDNSYMVIVAKGDYQVKAKINETNMQSNEGLRKGAKVIIRSRISNATWEGTIKSLRTDQKADEEETTSEEDYGFSDSYSSETDSKYPCVITLQSSKGLMLGQHVLVEVDKGQGSAADAQDTSKIVLEKSYIHEEGGKFYVLADEGGRLVKKSIKVGEYDEDGESYEVTGGLSLDDMIAADINAKEGMATTTNEAAAPESDEEAGDEESTGGEELEDIDGLEIDE